MHRRDAKDQEWQRTKAKVVNRDRVDRIFKVLNATEAIVLKAKAGYLLNYLDPAHIIPVSANSTIMYEPCNIVLLNRYSHEMLDSCRHPITGEHITRDEVNKWWIRILKSNSAQYFEFKQMLDINKIHFEGVE